MTPDQLSECLSTARWTPETLAKEFQCDDAVIYSWLSGSKEIPPKAAAWISALAEAHIALATAKPKSTKHW